MTEIYETTEKDLLGYTDLISDLIDFSRMEKYINSETQANETIGTKSPLLQELSPIQDETETGTKATTETLNTHNVETTKTYPVNKRKRRYVVYKKIKKTKPKVEYKYPLDEYGKPRQLTPHEKRSRILERNRINALRCRKRKKKQIQKLEMKTQNLKSKTDQLSKQIDEINHENQMLSIQSEKLKLLVVHALSCTSEQFEDFLNDNHDKDFPNFEQNFLQQFDRTTLIKSNPKTIKDINNEQQPQQQLKVKENVTVTEKEMEKEKEQEKENEKENDQDQVEEIEEGILNNGNESQFVDMWNNISTIPSFISEDEDFNEYPNSFGTQNNNFGHNHSFTFFMIFFFLGLSFFVNHLSFFDLSGLGLTSSYSISQMSNMLQNTNGNFYLTFGKMFSQINSNTVDLSKFTFNEQMINSLKIQRQPFNNNVQNNLKIGKIFEMAMKKQITNLKNPKMMKFLKLLLMFSFIIQLKKSRENHPKHSKKNQNFLSGYICQHVIQYKLYSTTKKIFQIQNLSNNPLKIF
ncbi:cyclic-amp response element binding protein [Anaeramoeba flamelloides]|uniref:Cyclic-amp response element binding protein n=1 Tax=Anaeramoeba flamelloides TaxID=1746091 RepID=A0ABQ8X6Z5_9EUKA|nr:cyclic-amp response element binding protein [Anaeramoeba flamelloides]